MVQCQKGVFCFEFLSIFLETYRVSLHFLSLFQVQKVSKNRDTELELKAGLPQETTCGGAM